MIAQSAGAAGAALSAGSVVPGGVPPAGTAGAPTDLLLPFSDAGVAPFSQALLSLSAGADLAVARAATTDAPTVQPGAGSAVPAVAPGDGAPALPADLLLALFPPEAVHNAGASGGSDEQATTDKPLKPQDPHLEPAAPDPGAALLAVVLQWLQQQSALTPRSAPAADVSAVDARSLADGGAARNGAAATAAIIIDADGSPQTRTRADALSGPIAMTAAAEVADTALSGRLADQRDPEARGAAGERSAPAPAATPGSAAGTIMDMAAALRAATTAGPEPVERSVAVPVHERHWPQALAAQVLVLSNEKMQAATLRLSPEHLGPVEVHIDLQDANVNVTFTAAHVETRAALEQALPQLRAVLAGAGLTLGQATVQQQARRESQNSNGAPRTDRDALEQPEALAAVTRALGMVDEYV